MRKRNIDSIHEYTVKNLNLYGITPFRRILSPELFQAAYGKPVRSSTILIPEVVFWLRATVSLTKRSMAGAITALWAVFQGSLPFLSPHPVTEEAFCIARKKMKLSFFKTIFRSVIQRYQSHYGDGYRWRGFRLLGIDGRKMSLPASPTLKKYFAPPSNQRGESKWAQGLLVGLVDSIMNAGVRRPGAESGNIVFRWPISAPPRYQVFSRKSIRNLRLTMWFDG